MKRAALTLGLVMAVAGCASPTPAAPSPPPAAVPPPSPAASPVVVHAIEPPGPGVPAIVVRALASPSPAVLPLSVVAGRNGADLRVALERILQADSFLTALSRDAAANARLDELLGVAAAVDQNSIVLAEIVGAISGQPQAEAILRAWRARDGSSIADQLAMGDLSAAKVQDLLNARNSAELTLADANSNHDPALGLRLSTVDARNDELARPLAAAMSAQAPSLAAPPTEGPDIDLRASLNRLLKEHIYLTGAAIEAAAASRTLDQQARVAAANDSADELGAQLAGVWGTDLGDGVAARLRAQTATLVALAAGGDRSRATADMDRLRTELDGLLSAANPLLPRGLLGQQLRPSDQPLLATADAFAARDFGTAYARLMEAARQVQKPADALALSIVDRYPGRYLVLPPVPAGGD